MIIPDMSILAHIKLYDFRICLLENLLMIKENPMSNFRNTAETAK